MVMGEHAEKMTKAGKPVFRRRAGKARGRASLCSRLLLWGG